MRAGEELPFKNIQLITNPYLLVISVDHNLFHKVIPRLSPYHKLRKPRFYLLMKEKFWTNYQELSEGGQGQCIVWMSGSLLLVGWLMLPSLFLP